MVSEKGLCILVYFGLHTICITSDIQTWCQRGLSKDNSHPFKRHGLGTGPEASKHAIKKSLDGWCWRTTLNGCEGHVLNNNRGDFGTIVFIVAPSPLVLSRDNMFGHIVRNRDGGGKR